MGGRLRVPCAVNINMRRRFISLALSALLPVRAIGQPVRLPAVRLSGLAPGGPLPAWLEPATFGDKAKPTEFDLVADEGRTVLRARARASASGLTRVLRVDPAEFPALAWRWKALNLVTHGNLANKEGTIAPNPYTDRVRMVVAESGSASLGRWVEHERDVAADFRLAFGLPVPPVTSLVLSADTDNTGESTEAYFGDIEFRRRAAS